jgi:DDE superfamily endonuclease
MNVMAFMKLERLLRPDIEPKIYANDKSIDSLTKVLVTLRYLRGGQYLDIMRKHNVGASTVGKCIKQVVEAICRNSDIGVPEWPNTVEKCQEYATEWARLSGPPANRGLFTTVIGMLDGLLINIESPKKMETNNQEDFRSGHKKRIGLNFQGLCDAKLKFLYVTMTTPGKTNDLKAYRFSQLSEMIERLPYGYFVGGDNAYVNSEHLIVPFSGRNVTPEQDTFNYYLSQLRVRIENTFALFVNRWGILWKPLKGKLTSHNRTILCLVKLHNFAIDNKVEVPKNDDKYCAQYQHLFSKVADDFGLEVLENAEYWRTQYHFSNSVSGSLLRETLVNDIASRGYTRPHHNLQCNQDRLMST